MRLFLVSIKNVLLWSYERGSWQYDLLCLLIVASIFLVPSRYFGDRDRLPGVEANPNQRAASKTSDSGQEIDAVELQAFLLRERKLELTDSPREALALYLHDQLKRDITDLHYTRFTNPNGQVVYRVWFK